MAQSHYVLPNSNVLYGIDALCSLTTVSGLLYMFGAGPTSNSAWNTYGVRIRWRAGVRACGRAGGRAGVRACGRAGVRACGHTTRTYVHTYIPTFLRTYVRTYVRTYAHTHAYIPCMQANRIYIVGILLWSLVILLCFVQCRSYANLKFTLCFFETYTFLNRHGVFAKRLPDVVSCRTGPELYIWEEYKLYNHISWWWWWWWWWHIMSVLALSNVHDDK